MAVSQKRPNGQPAKTAIASSVPPGLGASSSAASKARTPMLT
jgi:mevalonate kinase